MLLLPHSKEKLQSLCQAHFGLIPYSGASEPEVIHNLFLWGKLPLKSFHLSLSCEELWICSIFLRKACSEAFTENLIPSTPSLTCFPKGTRHTKLQELSTYSLSSWPLIRVSLSADSNCSWQRHGGLKDTQILGILWKWQHEEALGGSPPETPAWPSQVWQSWVLEKGAPEILWVCCKGMYQNHRQNKNSQQWFCSPGLFCSLSRLSFLEESLWESQTPIAEEGIGEFQANKKRTLCFWPYYGDFAGPPWSDVNEDQNLHALGTWDFASPWGHFPSLLQTTGTQMASTEPQQLPLGEETFPLQPRGLLWYWLLILG